MASYPTPKVHRPSRRSLGRGQHVQLPTAVATPVDSTITVVITCSQPVIASGILDLELSGGDPTPTLLSQVQSTPLVITQVYSGTVVGCDWKISGALAPVRTFQGGGLADAAGTF